MRQCVYANVQNASRLITQYSASLVTAPVSSVYCSRHPNTDSDLPCLMHS